ALMTLHNVPFEGPLVAFSAVVNIVGGLFLATNRHVRLTSFGFVLYIVLVNALLHDFWNFPDEMQNFIKNLGILAGLLVLAGASPSRPLNLRYLLASDKKFSA
ncbi:MAG: DoxX family protein, partial [Hyphomonadaceae bacterium]